MFAYRPVIMRTYAFLFALLVTLVCSHAQRARAQALPTTGGTLAPRLTLIGSAAYNTTARPPISAAQCAEPGQTITFKIDNLPGNNQNFIEVWVGNNCNETTRLDTTSGDPCVPVGNKEVSPSQRTVDIPIELEGLCEKEGDLTLYFLAVGMLNSASPVQVFGTYPVEIDISGPSAPQGVKGGSGETQIDISWNATDEEVTDYFVVWDAAPGATGPRDASAPDEDDAGALGSAPDACPSTLLVPNSTLNVRDLPDGLDGKRIDEKVSRVSLSGSDFGITQGVVAVAVIAMDEAGNISRLSNVACARVAPTLGIWDAYKESGGEVEPGCACTTLSARTQPLSAAPVLLALLGLCLRARRRRS